MAKVLSLFGDNGGDTSNTVFSPEELQAARDCITQAYTDDHADFLPPLRKVLAKFPDIAAAFAWLHAHERCHADDNAAVAILFALLDERMFTQAQRKRSAESAAGELEKTLRDKRIPDDVKIEVLPLLALAGRPVDDDAACGFFRDFDAVIDRRSREFLKTMSDSPEALSEILRTKGFIADEEEATNAPVAVEAASELLALGHRVAEVNPAGATLMTAALVFRVGAPDFSYERSPSQFDDIHALGTPRARWCLETLANWPGFAMPFRDKAARLAAELSGRGIECQAPSAPAEFSRCVVSMVDGAGSRTAALFFHTPSGDLDAFSLMLNDEVGVKDVQAFFSDGSMLEEMLRFNSRDLSIANAAPALFRELLADSFALHEELGTVPPGNLFPLMAYLGDEPVAPRRREPDLGAYKLETVRVTPKLVAGGAELADSALFGCLFPASDEAYAFCEAHWDKRRKSLRADAFSAFLQEIMPLERERLLRRMAVNLEVEALAGRAARRANKTAVRLWLGMKEDVAPFWTIPYVQELAMHGIATIGNDLRQGFHNQREAFAASGMGMLSPDFPEEDFGRLFGVGDLDAMSPADREAFLAGVMRNLFGGGGADASDFPPMELLREALERGAGKTHGRKSVAPRKKKKPE